VNYDTVWWNNQVTAYNSQSDVLYNAKIVWVDSGAWDSKILAARESGNAPDIVTYPISGVAQQAQYGTLSPLNGLISDMDTYLEDIDSNVLANITDSEGDIYGIPRYLEPSMLLYYRKDILEAAGWNNPPYTLAELEDCCADVKALLDQESSWKMRWTMQIASTNNDYGWVSWAIQAQMSGRISSLNENWTSADLTNYDDVANYWLELHSFEGVPEQALTSGGYKDDYAAIFEGKCAMQQSGSWIWGNLLSEDGYQDMIEKIGVSYWPTESGEIEDEVLCSLGGYSLSVDKGSDNQEAAADFIRFVLLSPESSSTLFDYFEAGNFCKISPRISVNNMISEVSSDASNQMRNLLVDVLLPNSMMEPTYPWEVSQYLGNAYVAVVSGGMTATQALAAAETEINSFIVNNNVSENRFN
jgi:multiple sugar transport system substrate-binding protein